MYTPGNENIIHMLCTSQNFPKGRGGGAQFRPGPPPATSLLTIWKKIISQFIDRIRTITKINYNLRLGFHWSIYMVVSQSFCHGCPRYSRLKNPVRSCPDGEQTVSPLPASSWHARVMLHVGLSQSFFRFMSQPLRNMSQLRFILSCKIS